MMSMILQYFNLLERFWEFKAEHEKKFEKKKKKAEFRKKYGKYINEAKSVSARYRISEELNEIFLNLFENFEIRSIRSHACTQIVEFSNGTVLEYWNNPVTFSSYGSDCLVHKDGATQEFKGVQPDLWIGMLAKDKIKEAKYGRNNAE